jgi:hypothetical protein
MKPKTPYTEARKGINYILTIAIDDYPDKQDKLENSKNDAINLIEILTSKYRFEAKNVKKIFDKNATRENILEQLRTYISLLNEEDSLVILYSGHASIDTETKKGYLLPYDKKDNSWSSCIAYSQLTDMIKNIKKPRHIALFLNCCYAGSFFVNNSKDRSISTYLDDRFLKKSRYAFAAGERNQKVSDKSHQQEKISPFAEYIVKFLKENTEDSVSIKTLAENVTQRVTENYNEQTPIHEVIQSTGHDGGEFSFQLKENEVEVWFKAFDSPTIESLVDAYQRFPKSSENVEKAKIILNKLQDERVAWVGFLASTKQTLSALIDNLDTKVTHYSVAKQTLTTLNNEYKKLTDKDESLRRFQEIQNESNIDKKIILSETFLEEFNTSKYYRHVKDDSNYYMRLKQQKSDWIKFSKMAQDVFKPDKKIAMYKAFLKDHFFGEYVNKANEKIKDIEKFIEVNKLYETNKFKSLDALRDYGILNGTDGVFSYKVRRMIKEVEELQIQHKQKEKLEDLKKEKSIEKLQLFIEDDNNHQEVRFDAIQYLKNLKEEVRLKFAEAEISNEINLFHEISINYKDYEVVEKAEKIFHEKLKDIYKQTIERVRIEKDVEPLKQYIKKYLQYEQYESAQIKSACEKVEEFEYEKEVFFKLIDDDEKTELLLNEFLEKFLDSIWKEDILMELEKMRKKNQGDELYQRCITEQKFEDLQKFVVEYKDSLYFTEVYPIYFEKRAEKLFFKIKSLVDLDKRQEAKVEILDYVANNKQYEHYFDVLSYKKKLEIRDNEDDDLEKIQAATSSKQKEQLCYNFLSNNDYLRYREIVKQILNPNAETLPMSTPLSTGNEVVQKSTLFPIKEIRLIGGVLIFLLIVLIGVLIYLNLN